MNIKTELPKAFVERVLADSFLGESLITALESEKPTAIRLNSAKNAPRFNQSRRIPWSKNGFFLAERPSFTLDPHYHGGTYYAQEAGSQFLDAALRQLPLPEKPIVLDLCAAPGGKSTLIADFLAGKGLLVANEVIQNRSKILKENLVKWGATNTVVSNNNPEEFQQLSNFFDCIVVDAPCSGEGMFRKDLTARSEWSESNVELCTQRQRKIVLDVWSSLKEGGYLIYSTCTFNSSENEDNVQWIMNQTGAEIIRFTGMYAIPDRLGLGNYALPHLLETEGLYFAILQKTSPEKSQKPKKSKTSVTVVKETQQLAAFIQSETIQIIKWSDYLFAIPEQYLEIIMLLHQQLRLIKMGTELGEDSRKGLLPNEALVLDPTLLSRQIPRYHLNKQQALSYLHGDTFQLEGKPGYGVMEFEGTTLGWIKHLGNRFNNLYPKDWRIRMRIN